MARKLASIQIINAIDPIEGYDRVELATVLGWSCIVKKDEFKVGDTVVYIEPDTQLPPHKAWEFLDKRRWRVMTLKMCKTVSQGLILPLEIIKEVNAKANYKVEEGEDLTEILEAEHYEKGSTGKDKDETYRKRNFVMKWLMQFRLFRVIYRSIFGKKEAGGFPTHLMPKSDEINIQAMPSILTKNLGEVFYITEKLEGQCGNYFLDPSKKKNNFIVCSHNVRKGKKPDHSNWWDIALKMNIEKKLRKYLKDHGIHLGVQGEIIGGRIQGNIYKINGLDFYVFNIRNLSTGEDYPLCEKLKVCEELGLKHVPVLNDNFIITDEVTPQKLLAMSNGKSALNKHTSREGYVLRRVDADRVSFKVKSPHYSLKNAK
jgi:hypothetical protein